MTMVAGYSKQGDGQVATVIRFGLWLNGFHWLPTPAAVMERFNVSRATAYRWLAIARDIRGGAAP